MKAQYEILSGIKVAILWRKNGSEETDDCPFCGRKHIHGTAQGHRCTHCATNLKTKFMALDGSVIDPEYGYIVKHY